MICTRCEKHMGFFTQTFSPLPPPPGCGVPLRPAGEPGLIPREPGPFLDAALVHAHAPAPVGTRAWRAGQSTPTRRGRGAFFVHPSVTPARASALAFCMGTAPGEGPRGLLRVAHTPRSFTGLVAVNSGTTPGGAPLGCLGGAHHVG